MSIKIGLSRGQPFVMTVLAACWTMCVTAATPEIRNATAKQRYPWNGKVDITYTLTGDVTAGLPTWNMPRLLVTASNCVNGATYAAAAAALSGDKGTAEGAHHVVWDMDAQGLLIKSTNVVFEVTYATAEYCVIDLSSGANASIYPVSYLADVPSGGWTDEYKTTKLVLRLVEPGTYKMQNTTDVTLTRPFYIGVFEVTQRQWELVMGTKPSYFSNAAYYAARPVEQVSYNMIRGSSSGAGWPGSSAVDASSFIGKIRAKTGINEFDLPTEAQWEYACRAGTTTDYNNGKNNTGTTCANMSEVGRYWYNGGQNYSASCDLSAGTAKVGSYLPNAWGLYDMHGNVWEWCLDWYGTLSYGTEPVGSSSGSYRVGRGGGWGDYADSCTSSYRYDYYPSSEYLNFGFRLVRTLSE